METVRCLTSSGQPNKKKKKKKNGRVIVLQLPKQFTADNTGRSKVKAMEAKGIGALRQG